VCDDVASTIHQSLPEAHLAHVLEVGLQRRVGSDGGELRRRDLVAGASTPPLLGLT